MKKNTKKIKADFSFKQFKGRIRRMYLVFLRRGYVEKRMKLRQGECSRCGTCCKLLFQCPFYMEIDNLPACKIHKTRPPVCRYFPIDDRDFEDRNRLNPGIKCGYSFKK